MRGADHDAQTRYHFGDESGQSLVLSVDLIDTAQVGRLIAV